MAENRVSAQLGEAERQAIAWAAFIHSLSHSKRTIYDINVEPLGEDGSDGNDLVDRMEW